MNAFFWLSFFFASPPSDVRAPADTCQARGTPLFEIRERSEATAQVTTKRIYRSGAWTLKSDHATARGCFGAKELRAIRRAVLRAPWQVTSSPVACFAYDPDFTEYVVQGRLRYTHRTCSGKTADFATLEAIELVDRALAEELPPPPAAPPAVHPTPPVARPPVSACRADGTPLFEIRNRSDVKEPTSTTKIYANGAWTFQPIDVDGRLGAATSGCFDRAALSTIRTAVRRAPWDVTFSRVVCRAYAPSFTEYYVDGRHEYTARLCGEQRLDDASAAAIESIEAELAAALGPTDPESTR
jgi:hypothetical protein